VGNNASDEHTATIFNIQSGTLKMEAECSSEMMALTYQNPTLSHNSEDRNVNLHSLKNLTSQNATPCFLTPVGHLVVAQTHAELGNACFPIQRKPTSNFHVEIY
jgi:hypothetical protein